MNYEYKYLKYKYKYNKLKKNIITSKKDNSEEVELNEVLELVNFDYKPKPIIQRKENDTIGDIIWRNRSRHKVSTSLDMPTKASSMKNLPHGLKLGTTNTMSLNDKNILNKLFDKFKNTKYAADYGTSIDLFSKLNRSPKYKGNRLTVNQVLDVIKEDQSHVNLVNFYFNKCLKNLNISKEKSNKMNLKEKVTFEILKYKDKTAELHCHIDNIKGGMGPIVTINIGPEFYYDFIPLLFNKEELANRKFLRVKINENQLVAIDGEVRYSWQHCIPSGIKAGKDKFTIKLIFPRIKKNNPIYNNFFKENLTTSF